MKKAAGIYAQETSPVWTSIPLPVQSGLRTDLALAFLDPKEENLAAWGEGGRLAILYAFTVSQVGGKQNGVEI